jgi:uncharacterized protein (DUF433 family)
LTASQAGPVTITFGAAAGHDPQSLLALAEVQSVTVDDGQVTVAGHSLAAAGVAAALAEQGVRPDDYRTHYPSLEDVFLALTGHRSEGDAS